MPARPDGSAVLARQGVRGVIGPISVVVLSVIWTLGMIQVLGFTLNLFIILIPTLLTSACASAIPCIIATYNQHRAGRACVVAALRQAMSERVCRACSPPDHGGGFLFLRGGYPAVPKWASTRPWVRSWPTSSVSSSCCSFAVRRDKAPSALTRFRGCPVCPPVLLPR